MTTCIPTAILIPLLAAACGTSSSRRAAIRGEAVPSSAAAPTDPVRTRLFELHMRDHYQDLRMMERYLVDGELDTVRDYAVALALDGGDPELAPWADQLARMRRAAEALGMAAGLDEAARLEPRLAATCGGCHRDAGVEPAFDAVAIPPDEPTSLARMARHQWAADRLWQAMVQPSDRAWREGLDVLAATPLPTAELTTVAAPDAGVRIQELGRRLQWFAKSARSAGSLGARATEYGEILVVCARCHALAK